MAPREIQTVPNLDAALSATNLLLNLGLANACEQQRCLELFDAAQPFATVIERCDSLHVHVKVDDTNALPLDDFYSAGWTLDYSKEGFIKFRCEDGINLIFSSMVIAQDELTETEENRRVRPFVDHFGIDLRNEASEVKASFETIPSIAESKNWDVVSQGSADAGVHCCHVEVAEKNWVFPSSNSPAPQIPLEFAFGKLQVNDVSGGCDLRPMNPAKLDSLGDAAPPCAG